MNTTENNKLLADFLNELTYNSKAKNIKKAIIIGNIGLGRTCINTTDRQIKEDLKKLDFHYNWNSLMRAVEEIETVETKDGRTFTIDIHKDNVIINQYGKYNNEIIVTGGGTRIENLYKACIEFVEWWNKEQSDNAIINSLDEWAKSGFVGIETIFGGKG